MMFSTAVRRGLRSGANTTLVRNASTTASSSKGGPGIPPSFLRSWYNIFGKSNAAYGAWIVGGVLVTELVTGFGIDSLWNSVNSGRTYESVDWSKFVVADDDEDDDDEDDDDEEEEDEGDADEEEEEDDE